MELKNENYITIVGWMRNELKLSGTSLFVYAAIYGFSQDGVNLYTGSIGWLAEFAGVTKRGVQKAIADLLEAGFLKKVHFNERTGTPNGYKASRPSEGGSELSSSPPKEGERTQFMGGMNSVHPGDELSSWGERTQFTPIINENINIKLNKQETKKETEKREDLPPAGEELPLSEVLSSMTDEQLADSYDTFSSAPVEDVTVMLETLAAYEDEFAKRALLKQGEEKEPKAKVDEPVLQKRKYPTWSDVIARYQFEPYVAKAMDRFIGHCLASGQKMTNQRLEALCDKLFSLDDRYPISIVAQKQLETIERALSGGYYDFKV